MLYNFQSFKTSSLVRSIRELVRVVTSIPKGISNILFGYDIFIAYSDADGIVYPQALFDQLTRNNNFTVFLATNEHHAGKKLGILTRVKVRNSKLLVVVGREYALTESTWVRREIDAHYERTKLPIFININGAIEKAREHNSNKKELIGTALEWLNNQQEIQSNGNLVDEVLYINETEQNQTLPSLGTTAEILGAFKGSRVSTRRYLAISIFLVCLVAITISSIYFARDARKNTLIARDNESSAFTALANSIAESNPSRAVKLTLAAWPTSERDYVPSHERAIDVLSNIIEKQRLRRIFKNMEGRIIYDSKFSSNGELVATASSEIHIWKTSNAKLLATFDPKKNGIFNPDPVFDFTTISKVSFAQNHPYLAFIAHDMVYVWNYISDEIIQKLPLIEANQINHVVFAGKDDLLITASSLGVIKSSELGTEKSVHSLELKTLNEIPAEVMSLMTSDDGSLLLASTNSHIYVFRSSTLKNVCRTKNGQNIQSVDFVDNEGIVITSSDVEHSSIEAKVYNISSNCKSYQLLSWAKGAKKVIHLQGNWYAALMNESVLIGMLDKTIDKSSLKIFGIHSNYRNLKYSKYVNLLLVDDVAFDLAFSKSIFSNSAQDDILFIDDKLRLSSIIDRKGLISIQKITLPSGEEILLHVPAGQLVMKAGITRDKKYFLTFTFDAKNKIWTVDIWDAATGRRITKLYGDIKISKEYIQGMPMPMKELVGLGKSTFLFSPNTLRGNIFQIACHSLPQKNGKRDFSLHDISKYYEFHNLKIPTKCDNYRPPLPRQ